MSLLAPIEAKVKAAASVSFLAGLAVALLNAVVANNALLGSLPAWLQAPLLAVVPFVLTFLGGYAAPHTARSDTAAVQAADIRPV